MKQILLHIALMSIEALIPTALLLPIVFLLCRRKGFGASLTGKYGLFLLYLCAVCSFTGLPTLPYLNWDPEVYLLPVIGMAEDVKNSLLNVALFVPMGFLLPLLCRKYEGWKKTLLFGLCATLFIELAQLFNYRLTDVNDVLTNLAGCALGYLLCRPLPKGKRPEGERMIGIITASVLAFHFVAQPYLLPIVWDWIF